MPRRSQKPGSSGLVQVIAGLVIAAAVAAAGAGAGHNDVPSPQHPICVQVQSDRAICLT